jgi:hypothetical protein
MSHYHDHRGGGGGRHGSHDHRGGGSGRYDDRRSSGGGRHFDDQRPGGGRFRSSERGPGGGGPGRGGYNKKQRLELEAGGLEVVTNHFLLRGDNKACEIAMYQVQIHKLLRQKVKDAEGNVIKNPETGRDQVTWIPRERGIFQDPGDPPRRSRYGPSSSSPTKSLDHYGPSKPSDDEPMATTSDAATATTTDANDDEAFSTPLTRRILQSLSQRLGERRIGFFSDGQRQAYASPPLEHNKECAKYEGFDRELLQYEVMEVPIDDDPAAFALVPAMPMRNRIGSYLVTLKPLGLFNLQLDKEVIDVDQLETDRQHLLQCLQTAMSCRMLHGRMITFGKNPKTFYFPFEQDERVRRKFHLPNYRDLLAGGCYESFFGQAQTQFPLYPALVGVQQSVHMNQNNQLIVSSSVETVGSVLARPDCCCSFSSRTACTSFSHMYNWTSTCVLA